MPVTILVVKKTWAAFASTDIDDRLRARYILLLAATPRPDRA